MASRETLTGAPRGAAGAGPIANVVGWSLGALVVAIAVEFGAMILIDDVLDAAIDPLTGGAVVPYEIGAVLSALLVGGSIGAVVGSRVTAWPLAVSVIVTLVYLVSWPFGLVGPGSSGLWTAIASVVHVGSAVGLTRFMTRRRSRP